MTTCLGKSCSFGLPRMPFVNCCQFMYLVISHFGFEGKMWDLIVSVPDHCLFFYFNPCQKQLEADIAHRCCNAEVATRELCCLLLSGVDRNKGFPMPFAFYPFEKVH